ncbi:MAG TPA: TetR/AcrR family transcriptional regulator [Deltaproteobacteria bacterium]|nr:TetR/AcrR family transcriptional regulator [Deltaproteobacteria bacterium]
MKFKTFENTVVISKEDIYRDLFKENQSRIRIKKEETAIKNLARIFDAALTISNEKGFSAMSLRDLSSEAGLSMGALYSYISSKDDLLDMLLQQGRIVVFRVLLEQIAGVDSPRDRLKIAVQTHLYLSEIMQPWFYFLYMETKNFRKEDHKKAIESELFTENIFQEILDQGISAGQFRPVDVLLTSAVIKAMLQDWYLKRWKYERRNVSVEEYAGFLMEVLGSHLHLEKT